MKFTRITVDPNVWSGRALQENFVESVVSGLANVSGLLLERGLLAIMDISARAISLADRLQPSHSGHQCSHAPGRPNLHLVSSSRRPRQRPVNFSRRTKRLTPRPALPRSFGHEPERSKRSAPACWQRDRQNIAVQPLLGGVDPGFEAVALPALRLNQHDPCRLYEQDPQVAIATPGYLAQDGAVASRDLFGDKPQPSGKVAAFGEPISSTDRGHHRRAGDDRADAGDADQPLATAILARNRLDLIR